MVVINQCRIDQDGKHLIIEATVENLSYYKDVYITGVIIDTQETFVESGPSNRAIYHNAIETPVSRVCSVGDCCQEIKTEDNECIDTKEKVKSGAKHILLYINKKDLGVSLDDNIFFVYIVTHGYPSPDTPCGMDNTYTRGIAVNMRPIYNMAMQYIKELNSNCTIPKGFIDMILRLKAFELALKTGNFPTAFKWWDKLFKNKVSISPNRSCGCNGIN